VCSCLKMALNHCNTLPQGQMTFPQVQIMSSVSPNIAATTHTSHQSPDVLSGSSASLIGQMKMIAMSSQSSHQLVGNYSLQSGGLQFRQHTETNFDSILSRMVVADGSGVGSGVMPFRVASRTDFRRSVNSLNTVHEASVPPRARQAPNLSFAAVPEEMSSRNPLLKMMEERMSANAAAATKEQPMLTSMAVTSSSPPTSENQTSIALHASINKWAGVPSNDRTHHQKKETFKRVSIQQSVASPQGASVRRSPSGRVPLSPKQKDLLNELQDESLRKQLLLRQASEMDLSQVNLLFQNSNTNVHQQGSGTAGQGLTRCVVSSAEMDRLRRQNCSIQLGRQMLSQERMNEQVYLHHQQLIAASAMVSMQSSVGGHRPPLSQEEIQQISFDALKKFKKSSSNNLNSIKPSKSSTSLRKRSSHPDDDNTVCTSDTVCSNSPSLTSSAASSNKIHRSISHCSARTALNNSMDNLRVETQSTCLNNCIMRNQSFSSGLNASGLRNSSKLIMANQIFSLDPNSLPQQRFASKEKVNSSSTSLISSLLSQQSSAGNAAALFAIAVQNSHDSQMTPPREHPKEDEGVVSPKSIKVEAEEYPPPAVDRTLSTSTEVFISTLPDNTKYHNVKLDKKPIDVVKEALSSRGAKCDTKPSMEMEEGFFVTLTEMYDQEVVNAIRSNDVVSLRKLHVGGTNLQCGNRFGETLIHLACRRSQKQMVSFLLDEAGVSLRVRDDFGRTPFHDACWRAEPDLDLLDILLDRAPELLMLSDKRGHTPLCYSRREHWDVLVPFLLDRTDKFRPV
jgi:hypothetical protein